MSYRPRDWRYERDERSSYDDRRERRDWRGQSYRSSDRPYSSYSSSRLYDAPRSREYRDYTSSSSARPYGHYDRRAARYEPDRRSSYDRPADRDDEYRREREGRRTSRAEAALVRDGIKDRDVGYALLSKEERSHVRRSLRRQISAEDKITAATSMSPAELTPRQVVEEFKRAGHFDSIRKQLFLAFQSSAQKGAFIESIEQLLLKRLENLSDNRRQRLSMQDKRLQHSELNKWIEEDPKAAEAFQTLFASLRGGDSLDAADGSEKGTEECRNAFLREGGRLAADVESRLSELIQAQRQKLSRNGDNSDSDDDDGDSASTPAAFPSSVTPMGQETPRRTASVTNTSIGGRTPAQSANGQSKR